jgi:Leu/Phe-tRNA-protein transferase
MEERIQLKKIFQKCIRELHNVSNMHFSRTIERMILLRQRLQRFNEDFNQAPKLCAEAARKRITRIEKECCRRVCHRHNIDATRSIVLSFL